MRGYSALVPALWLMAGAGQAGDLEVQVKEAIAPTGAHPPTATDPPESQPAVRHSAALNTVRYRPAGVSLGGVVVKGRCRREQIERDLRGRLYRVRSCLARAMRSAKLERVSTTLGWKVTDPDRRIQDLVVAASEVDREQLHACLTTRLATLRFPRAALPCAVEARVRADRSHRPVPVLAGAPEIEGPCDAAAVRRLLGARDGLVRGCLQSGKAGELRVMWTVGPTGSVESTAIQGSTFRDDSPARCVVRRSRLWRFPRPSNGGTCKVRLRYRSR